MPVGWIVVATDGVAVGRGVEEPVPPVEPPLVVGVAVGVAVVVDPPAGVGVAVQAKPLALTESAPALEPRVRLSVPVPLEVQDENATVNESVVVLLAGTVSALLEVASPVTLNPVGTLSV